ncbi:hypothetical protein B6U83_02070, partial [Thermoplasmatales archaeon ex4484_36]
MADLAVKEPGSASSPPGNLPVFHQIWVHSAYPCGGQIYTTFSPLHNLCVSGYYLNPSLFG